MDVKGFRTFLEVAKEQHFGRAAENLYITQAAVSSRIKQLELHFGCKLFVRERHAIQLTQAGKRLLPYAELMVQTLEQAQNALQLDVHQRQQLVLGGTPNSWDAVLQPWFGTIVETLEGYCFAAETLSMAQISRNLNERTLDLAVTFDKIKVEGVISQPINQLLLVLVSTSAVTVEEALSQRYHYVDWGSQFAAEHSQRHRFSPVPLLRCSNGRIALELLLEKGGAAYLPESTVAPLLARQQLHQVVAAPPWPRTVYLSYRKDSPVLSALLEVLSLLQQSKPEPPFVLQQVSQCINEGSH